MPLRWVGAVLCIRDWNATASPEWTPRFLPGTKIACGNSIITISVSSTAPDRLTALRSTEGWIVAIGSNLRPGEKATDLAVNRLLIRISRAEAPRFLLPIAERTAARIRRNPTRWQIAHGHKTLGSCFSDGRISLSEILIFLPVRLIDYVICHELAHLTEMNHSRKFHDLCNRYCNGIEKQLERELKAFSWPIIR